MDPDDQLEWLRNGHGITLATGVGFLFVFKAWQQAHSKLRNCCHNTEDRQKDKPVVKIISCTFLKTVPSNTTRTLAIIVFLIHVLAGCTASKPLYYWGEYEDLLYSRFVNPGETDPATQVIKLTQVIQIAQNNGQRVPPGVHAHLGYMLYTQGNVSAALQSLKTEKALYPEASIFIDRMIDRLTQ